MGGKSFPFRKQLQAHSQITLLCFFLYLNKLSWAINLDTLRRWWSSPTQKMSPLRQSGKKYPEYEYFWNSMIYLLKIAKYSGTTWQAWESTQTMCITMFTGPGTYIYVQWTRYLDLCSLDQVPGSMFTGPGTLIYVHWNRSWVFLFSGPGLKFSCSLDQDQVLNFPVHWTRS